MLVRTSLLAAGLLLLAPPAGAEFVRPKDADAPLVWGVKGGVTVAVHPAALDRRPDGGPRGLLRVGYEEAGKHYLLNYIAVEPVVGRDKGFSELEKGGDGKQGKRFWVGDRLTDGGTGRHGNVGGRIEETPAGRVLTFVVHVEPFTNGARPVVEVSLFEKQPDRLRLRTFAGPGGEPMRQCILTATMGNQSRCRHLWLKDHPVFAPDLYAGYTGTDFVEKDLYPPAELRTTAAGAAVAVITPDEFEPREAWPLPGDVWHHPGRWLAQFWLKPKGTADASLRLRVNGRRAYWAGTTPIPGGPSFENFELREDFAPGRESWFGFTADPAKLFGFPYDAAPTATPKRTIPADEVAEIIAAGKADRPLTNGRFRDGLDGWRQDAGGPFRVLDRGGAAVLTSAGKAAGSAGRVYQCFTVPADADALRFELSGAGDGRKGHVALWRGDRLYRRTAARDGETPFRVRWDLAPVRGEVLTLELADRGGERDALTAHGFEVERTK